MLRAVAEARAQTEESRAARHVSRIPLSKAGVRAAPQWGSTYAGDFHGGAADLTANRAAAAAVSAMFKWAEGVRGRSPTAAAAAGAAGAGAAVFGDAACPRG
jgi:hypothetical protein